MRNRRLIDLAVAALIGLAAFLAFYLPRENGLGYFNENFIEDTAVSVNGMYLYLKQPGIPFPLFEIPVPELDATSNLAFTDSAPIYTLLLKLFWEAGLELNPFLVWMVLVFVLQAICFHELLRVLGVRQASLRYVGAAMSLCLPSFLMRMAHPILTGNFAVIVPLLLFFGLKKKSTGAFVGLWAAWLSTALLIHPYFAAMSGVIYLGGVIDRALNSGMRLSLPGGSPGREPRCSAMRPGPASRLLGHAAGPALAVLPFLVAGLSLLIGGHLQHESVVSDRGGFGYYSMNILSPLAPHVSGIFPYIPPVNATGVGGQSHEGYNYLGLGIIVGLALAILYRWRNRRHSHGYGNGRILSPGLVFWTCGLFLYSLSNKIYFGNTLILDLSVIYRPFSDITGTFRSSGRMFWPVSYLLLALALRELGRAKTILRLQPRFIALALFLLQAVDVSTIWKNQINRPPSLFNHEGWVSLFSAHDRMEIWPRSGCISTSTGVLLMGLELAANRYGMSVNSITTVAGFVIGRCRNLPVPDESFSLAPGTLYIFGPEITTGAIARDIGVEYCREFRYRRSLPMLVCTDQLDLLRPGPEFTRLTFDARLAAGRQHPFRSGEPSALRFLYGEWRGAGKNGVWSRSGSVGLLLPRFQPAADSFLLDLAVQAALSEQVPCLEVSVTVNDESRALWVFTWQNNSEVRSLRVYLEDMQVEFPVIRFSLPEDMPSSDVNESGDTRRPGLFFKTLTALPVPVGPGGPESGAAFSEADAWEKGRCIHVRSGAEVPIPAAWLRDNESTLYLLASSAIDDFDERMKVEVYGGERHLATWEFSADFNRGWRRIDVSGLPGGASLRFVAEPPGPGSEGAEKRAGAAIHLHRAARSAEIKADNDAWFSGENILDRAKPWRLEVMTAGWDNPGRNDWSTGGPMGVSLRCDPSLGRWIDAEFDVHAFLPPGETRRVSLSVNGRPLSPDWEFTHAGNRGRRTLKLDCAIAREGRLLLKLEMDRADSPKNAGLSNDARMLGIGLAGIRVRSHQE